VKISDKGGSAFQFEDFTFVKLLAAVNGKVYLVQHTPTQTYMVMKSIRKDFLIEKDHVSSVYLERLIMEQEDHPFIIKLQSIFVMPYRVYFLMDYVRGGDLRHHMEAVRRMNSARTRFLAAQIALALGQLHSKQIVYRDLKPENVLVREDGYVILSDFGVSRVLKCDQVANSFCGTTDYMRKFHTSLFSSCLAPEVILGTGHDLTADWWALGIMM
jgi:serum/glucocorticoid-regulated kinase 1